MMSETLDREARILRTAPSFLESGGEMGNRMRCHDWALTPVGEPNIWPQSLRTVVRLLLTSNHPMFIFWGPEHLCFYNDAYSASMGPEKHPEMLGARAEAMWSEIWTVIGPQIDQVMAGDGATWHDDQLVPIYRNGRLDEVYWTYGFSPIDDDAAPNGVGGVLVLCNETTAKVRAQRHLKLLVDELNHRVKNTLSVVQSLARQTFRQDATSDAARIAFEGRLVALAQAHNLLTEANWETADLAVLVDQALILHAHGRHRFTASGPSVDLGSKTAVTIAMALHELATNATKYGALSVETGHVTVTWQVERVPELRLRLVWAESEGPAVAMPTRRGFGTRLVETVLARDLDGTVRLAFHKSGVVCEIEACVARPAIEFAATEYLRRLH